jgi:hypothetical protein
MSVLDIIRYIGIVVLALAFPFTWAEFTWIALGMLVTVGLIDLVLVIADKDTVSNWIHDLFPKAIDFILMMGLLVFVWFTWGAAGFLPVIMGVVMGHLFWHDD